MKAEPWVLEMIECVTYALHPSVNNPIREVCVTGQPDRPFASSGQGWATYVVNVMISFKDSDIPDIHKTHPLSFASQ